MKRTEIKLTNFDVFWRKMPLANVHTPFFYLFSETWVDNSQLSWHATPTYWAVCFRHRLIYSVSVMAANFQGAPLMSRDDLNFRAITYSPETGPFPDTPLERLCLKVKVQEKNASFREQESPLPLVDPCAKICTAYSYCNERAKSTFQLDSLFWKN